MADNTIKETEHYKLTVIPKESGDVKFIRFRDLLMGDDGSNMHKIDEALAQKGAVLKRNRDNGTIELRDEKGRLLSSVSSTVAGEAFTDVRIADPSADGWKHVRAEDADGVINLCPGDNIHITADGSEITVSADVHEITVDSDLSSTSENPVQNKVINAALAGKLGKSENAASATKATQDESGNNIKSSYGARIGLSATGKNLFLYNKNGSEISAVELPDNSVTVDEDLSATSENPVQNKVINAALAGKLGKNENAASATKAAQDEDGDSFKAKYGTRIGLSATGKNLFLYNKNGSEISAVELPDNSVTVDDELSSTSENPVQNKVISDALAGKLGKSENAASATKAAQDESGNNIKASYGASLSISDHKITLKNKNGVELSSVTVPDNDTKIIVDSDLSATSENPVQNKVINTALAGKLGKSENAASATKATQDEDGDSFKEKYGTRIGMSATGKNLFLYNKNGSEISAVELPDNSVTVDSDLSGTSENPVQNKVINAALAGKLGKSENAASATKATQDESGNNIKSS